MVCHLLQDHGERLLHTPGNPISLAITLDNPSGWIRQANHPAAAEPTPADASTPTVSDPSGVAEPGHPQEGPAHSADQRPQQSSPGTLPDSSANLHLQSMLHLQNADLARSLETDNINSAPSSQCSHQHNSSHPAAGAAAQALAVARNHRLPHQEMADPPEAGRSGQLQPPITFLGSKLFSKCVSGTRVIARHKHQTVAGYSFEGYGSHCDDYGHCYLTAAAALGATMHEVDEFLRRLDLCMKQFRKQALG